MGTERRLVTVSSLLSFRSSASRTDIAGAPTRGSQTHFRLRLVVVALIGLASVARAAPPSPEDCEAPDPTTAEVNSREGIRLAKAGQFEAAVALFKLARQLDPCSAEYPFLLARALVRLGRIDEARDRYRYVVNRFPSSREATKSALELAELDKREKQKKPPVIDKPPDANKKPPVAVIPTRLTKQAAPPWQTIGYATAGAGVLFLAGGIYYALDAKAADDDLSNDPGSEERYDELVDQRSGSTTLAYVMYGAAGVMLAAGAVMAFVLPEPATGGGTVTVSPGGQGRVNIGYRFDF